MLNEFYLNKCLKFLLNLKDKHKKRKSIVESILHILDSYMSTVERDDYPPEFKDKLELCYFFAKYRNKHKVFCVDSFLEKLHMGKYCHLTEYLSSIRDVLDDETIDIFFDDISKKRIAFNILADKDNIKKLIDDIETGNFEDEEEIMSRWEENLTINYKKLLDVKKSVMSENVAALDFLDDDYSGVVNQLRSTVEETTATGYNLFKKILPNKGFERRRLYLFCGTSGLGKSTLLVNLMCNAIKERKLRFKNNQKEIPREKWSTFIYVTAENQIDDSWYRIYACMFDQPVDEVLAKVKEDDDFANYARQKFRDELIPAQSNIKLIYIEPHKNTVSDVESLISPLCETNNIEAIYLDYLDLLKTNNRGSTELRHQLGEVTNGLRNIGLEYNISMISASQLNRDGYNSSIEASLVQMSESMLKANNSDFVAFLQQPKEKTASVYTQYGDSFGKLIKVSVTKNRNGKSGDYGYMILPEECGDRNIFAFKILEYNHNVDNNLPNANQQTYDQICNSSSNINTAELGL